MDEGTGEFLRAEDEEWRCPKCGGAKSCRNGVGFEGNLERLRDKKRLHQWDS